MTLKEALDALPKTPDEIADKFRAEGIRGIGSPASCPLARYLQGCGFPGASVGLSTAYAGREIPVPLPAGAHTFRWQFDAGQYPDLVRG